MSAEETLATVQSLYEKKVTTYPRVDTTYLSEDLYPKVAGILRGLVIPPYLNLVSPLLSGAPIRKSKKVFDNKKVTDHHAIIPTGQSPSGLSETETKVFDLIARHFIAAFYPDCLVSTTSVEGTAGKVKFKTSGKEILEPGWRVVFETETPTEASETKEGEEGGEASEALLPDLHRRRRRASTSPSYARSRPSPRSTTPKRPSCVLWRPRASSSSRKSSVRQ